VTPASASANPSPASRIGLWLGPLASLVILLTPAPADLPPAAWHAAAVAVLMAIWWLTEAIPIPATALLPLVLLPLLGLSSVTAAAAPYANPIIFLFLGGFIIAIALERCGLHKRLALSIVRVVGTRPKYLVGGFMLATAFLSMWVSNSATVVMMLPMALSVIALTSAPSGDAAPATPLSRNFPLALLLGLAYAANIGGLATLIGTPPNALLARFMAETFELEVAFAEWMVVGVPLVVVGLPLCWLLLVQLLFPLGDEKIIGGEEAIAGEWSRLGPMSRREVIVGSITALVASAWVFRPLLEPLLPGLNDTTIAIAGALLLFLVPPSLAGGAPLIRWSDAEKLPWSVLILFGGGLSLASAIQTSGLADAIGRALAPVAVLPLWAVVAIVTAIVIFLTELTSNTATAAAFLPVVASLAVGIGADPLTLTLAAALAASCAFMLPVATPPNAIVFGSGHIRIPQMARAGVWLNLLFIVLVTIAAIAGAPILRG
jgi:solute carrier family 13 (sodium-dependent dicarboxylate transporter), member 2/3/5